MPEQTPKTAAAPKTVSVVVVVGTVQRGRKVFAVGEEMTLPKAEAASLLARGVVKAKG